MFVLETLWRVTVAIAFLMVAVFVPQANGQSPPTPYYASVKSSTALVRSGPGKVHYATQQLSRGADVQVYRHDPGGWLAIRPPKGSFSLIQADRVNKVEGGWAQVKEGGAPSWVGTRLNPVDQPMWQVQLKPGELLKVLGQVDRERFDLDEEQPDWIQIAPPDGEFRWIHQDDLDLSLPKSAKSRQSANRSKQAKRADNVGPDNDADSVPVSESWDSVEPDKSNSVRPTSPGSSPNLSTGWKPASRSIDSLVSQRSEFVAETTLVKSDQDSWGTGGALPAHLASLQTPNLPNPPQMAGGVPAASPPQVQQLEMMLTRQLLNPPAQWELSEIANMAAQLRSQSYDAKVQAAAERIIAKIRRCHEIQAGYRAANQTESGASPNLGQRTNRAVSSSSPVSGNPEFNNVYDAHGWLSELIRDGGRGVPGFVLQDKDGKVTHHVAAPPGFNLRRYLNQRVGIIGSRGYHSQLQIDHVTAERVIVIENLRR